MTEYNSRAIEEFSDIWVFCEQRDGKFLDTGFELLSKGRDLADQRGSQLIGLILGGKLETPANILGGYGADKVIVIEDPALETYNNELYTKVLTDIIKERKPEVLLVGATSIGRDLAPRCAGRLRTGLTADCTHLDIDMHTYKDFLKDNSNLDVETVKLNYEDVNLKMTRPAFGGHLIATIICPDYRPCMATVRPGVMKKAPYDPAKAATCPVEILRPALSTDCLRERVIEVTKAAKATVDLSGADVIVAIGNGAAKDIEKARSLAEDLAAALGGGVVAASRALVDAGLMDESVQIGQTGKTVHPKVYVALGISGAIQHISGMQDSELIIAVNRNEKEPIFEVADYGLVGDLFQIVPEMIQAIKEEADR